MVSAAGGRGSLGRRAFLAAGAGAPLAVGATASSAAADGGAGQGRRVTTGAMALARSGFRSLRGRRVGVVSNPTGVLDDLSHVVDAMHGAGLDVGGVFGPEHGFRGSAQAGGSEGTGTDARTGLTVYDAYGADGAAFEELYDRADVDTVVFDIQDVGSRFYTYVWTMYHAQVAAARSGRRFVVLDRPNPVGGRAAGPMMTPTYTSGVGLKEVVQQHGMTVGELARMFNDTFVLEEAGAPVELVVEQVRGWRRSELHAATGLPWVPPSPNMPTPETALVYPGTCLFEGTNLSEGRGTTRPFEWIGAPWADHHWSDDLNAAGLRGVRFRESYFVPSFSKHVGATCAGVQVHVTEPQRFDAIRTAVTMLVALKARYADFAWRVDAWDTARPYWIDKLTGSTRLREQVDAGAGVDEVVAAWADELAAFERHRRPYLLYR